MAVLAPMPNASDATTTLVNRRLRPTFRSANRTSDHILDIWLTTQDGRNSLHDLHGRSTPVRQHVLLEDGDLMAESNDLSLLGGTGPKRGGDRARRAMKNGLIVETMMISRTERKTCIFNADGVFGIHRIIRTKA